MNTDILKIGNLRGYVDENGTAWLNAEDVARGWGFTQEKNGVEYVRWERLNGYLQEFRFFPLVGKEDFLPENIVYRLGFKAKNEKAVEFQMKLANEVLPSTRKTGQYSTKNSNPSYQIEDSIARAEAWIEEEKQRRLLAEENIQLTNVVAEQKPKIEYVDKILQSPKAIPITVIAQDYGMTCQQMNQLLKDLGIQYLCSGSWILKSQYQGRGYTDSETKNHENNQAFVYTKWTQKGRLFLYEKLKNAGYLPTIEQ